jgi:hypothetical protein
MNEYSKQARAELPPLRIGIDDSSALFDRVIEQPVTGRSFDHPTVHEVGRLRWRPQGKEEASVRQIASQQEDIKVNPSATELLQHHVTEQVRMQRWASRTETGLVVQYMISWENLLRVALLNPIGNARLAAVRKDLHSMAAIYETS